MIKTRGFLGGILFFETFLGISYETRHAVTAQKSACGVSAATFSRASTVAIDSAIHHLNHLALACTSTTFDNVRCAERFQCFNRGCFVGFEAIELISQDRLTKKRKQSRG